MRSRSLVLTAVLACLAAAHSVPRAHAQDAAFAPGWEPAKTYALLVGVLTYKDTRLKPPTPPDGTPREDHDLENALIAAGVPRENVVFVADEQATTEAVRREARALASKAGPGSTFLFYFDGHGFKVRGKLYLGTHDVDSKNASTTGFGAEELAAILDECWKGSTLIVMGDCCHSGALRSVVEHYEGNARVRAAGLASCMASNISTLHWTFTHSLVEAFKGDGAIDKDRDGQVRFGELDEFIHREMRYRERQLTHAFHTSSFGDGFAIHATDPNTAVRELDGPWKLRDYCDVQWKDKWYPAQVVDAKGDADKTYKIHYLGYKDSDDEWVPPERMRPTEGGVGYVDIGQAVSVEWKGKWYDAKIVATEDSFFYLIHYDADSDDWNEWVTSKRLKLK